MYEKLTRHIRNLETDEFQVKDSRYFEYSEPVVNFLRDLHSFSDEHPDAQSGDFAETLAANGIDWELDSMTEADETNLDGECIVALLSGAIRGDRFCEGAFMNFLENGAAVRWLKRLVVLDTK